MLSVWQHSTNRRRVTGEFVGDHHAGIITDAVNNLTKEAFGRQLITPQLDQDVQDDAILIDGTPKPVALR